MDYIQLLEQNIWWKSADEIDNDIHIKRYLEKNIKWDPELEKRISLKPFSFNIVIGPRQAGKTTAIKIMIKKLLKEYTPKQIFYFNCDELSSYEDIIKLIRAYLDIRKEEGIKNSIIILDEITSPANWTKAIKSIMDKGLLELDIIIATGSNSIRIKREAEYFPGRRGNGKDVILLPLSFRDFVKVHDPKLIEKIPAIIDFNNLNNISKAANYLDELNKYLKRYMQIGGFPLAINEEKNNFEAKKAYKDGIISDILKVGGDVNKAKETIITIISKMPSHFSYNNIGKDIGNSSKTVESYANMFEDLYVSIVLKHVDISSKTFKYGKNKKIALVDPLLFTIFKEWTLSDVKIDESILAESIAASHIARLDISELSIGNNIGYWSNGTEVDVVVRGKRLGFEVKWSESIDISKYKKIEPHFKRLSFLSKKDYGKKIYPLACFLVVIGV